MLSFDAEGIKVLNAAEIESMNLYEIYYSDEEEPLRLVNYDVEVLWQGNVYTPNVVKHSDITFNSDGQINEITLTVGNVDRIIQYYIEQYDMIGKKARTIEIFVGTNCYIPQTFKIKGAKVKKDFATFSLSMGFDYLLTEVPSRKMFARFCGWTFKGADGNCPYTGSDLTCEHTFEACKAKGCLHRFGGFPAIINERIYF